MRYRRRMTRLKRIANRRGRLVYSGPFLQVFGQKFQAVGDTFPDLRHWAVGL